MSEQKLIDLETLTSKLRAIPLPPEYRDSFKAAFAHVLADVIQGPVTAETFLLIAQGQITSLMQGERLSVPNATRELERITGLSGPEYAAIRRDLPWIAERIDPTFGAEVRATYDELVASLSPMSRQMYDMGLR